MWQLRLTEVVGLARDLIAGELPARAGFQLIPNCTPLFQLPRPEFSRQNLKEAPEAALSLSEMATKAEVGRDCSVGSQRAAVALPGPVTEILLLC